MQIDYEKLSEDTMAEWEREWEEAKAQREVDEAQVVEETLPIEDYEEYDDYEDYGSFDLSDDGDALASAGWGTDEDYGYYGD